MKKIDKRAEPKAWTEHCATPNADYEAIPELRIALYEEQGGICAYCGRRLFDEHECRDKASTNVVEHVIPRSKPYLPKNGITELTYNNLVLSCCGTIGKASTCDEAKGNSPIHFSPVDDYVFTTLTCGSNGKLKSSDNNIQQDFDKTLNLNTGILVANRKEALKAVNNVLIKLGYSKKDIRRIIKEYESMKNGLYKEYSGEIINYLTHKLNTPIR